MKPILKWPGGKRQILGELIPRLPKEINRYFEPFFGSGALFFAIEREGESFISDVNFQLMNVYRQVANSPEKVHEHLSEFVKKNSEDFFYEIRNWDREPDFKKMSLQMMAARVLYLNRTSFNGLYRENSKGHFNAPWGKYQKPAFPGLESLQGASKLLRGATIWNRGFCEVLGEYANRKGDFVYIDPPYLPVKLDSFVSYSKDGFDIEDHKRLAKQCFKMDRLGVNWMVSSSDSPIARKMFDRFLIEEVSARRNINRNGEGRGAVTELIIRNYE